jgi:hypothetical protein
MSPVGPPRPVKPRPLNSIEAYAFSAIPRSSPISYIQLALYYISVRACHLSSLFVILAPLCCCSRRVLPCCCAVSCCSGSAAAASLTESHRSLVPRLLLRSKNSDSTLLSICVSLKHILASLTHLSTHHCSLWACIHILGCKWRH